MIRPDILLVVRKEIFTLSYNLCTDNDGGKVRLLLKVLTT